VVTPFVGTVFPGDDVLHNLPFALANKALSLKEALNVKITVAATQRFINGTEQTVQLPVEAKVSYTSSAFLLVFLLCLATFAER